MGGRKSAKISALKPFIGKQAKIFAAALTGTLFAVQSLGAIVNLRGPAPENYVWVASHRADWHHAPENSKTFRLLPRVLDSGAKAFVAATWADHTAGHDDRVSFFDSPDKGWGWLTAKASPSSKPIFPANSSASSAPGDSGKAGIPKQPASSQKAHPKKKSFENCESV